jgi:hypothetical protein
MSGHSPVACEGVKTSGPSCAYTQGVGSVAHRLTSVVIAVVLSGSPAVLSACMALCFGGQTPANATELAHEGHDGHAAVTAPAAASPHAHHGPEASPQPPASVADRSPRAPSHARLVSTCDNCCIAGPVAFAAVAGVERTNGKSLGLTPTAAVMLFQASVAAYAAVPSSPPVPPPSPTRAPLALRI